MHNDFPLVPEKLEISHDMLYIYCSNIADIAGGVNKLIPNLADKDKYIIHYNNLQLYLSLGMKLAGVHRIPKFKQSDWLMKYMDFNTKKKKNSVNSFEKVFFKLMKNCVYGTTRENFRKIVAAIHEIKPVLTPVLNQFI